MAERRSERTTLNRQWRQDINVLRILDGTTIIELAKRTQIDRKTVGGILDTRPELVVTKPEHVGKLVMALNVDEIYKAYLLGLVGYQLPLYPRMHVWNINMGPIGSFVENIRMRYKMTEGQWQWFGDIVTSFAERVAGYITTGGRRPPFADNPVTV